MMRSPPGCWKPARKTRRWSTAGWQIKPTIKSKIWLTPYHPICSWSCSTLSPLVVSKVCVHECVYVHVKMVEANKLCVCVCLRSVEGQVWTETQERTFHQTGWRYGKGAAPLSPEIHGGYDVHHWAKGTGNERLTPVLTHPFTHHTAQMFSNCEESWRGRGGSGVRQRSKFVFKSEYIDTKHIFLYSVWLTASGGIIISVVHCE